MRPYELKVRPRDRTMKEIREKINVKGKPVATPNDALSIILVEKRVYSLRSRRLIVSIWL